MSWAQFQELFVPISSKTEHSIGFWNNAKRIVTRLRISIHSFDFNFNFKLTFFCPLLLVLSTWFSDFNVLIFAFYKYFMIDYYFLKYLREPGNKYMLKSSLRKIDNHQFLLIRCPVIWMWTSVLQKWFTMMQTSNDRSLTIERPIIVF